MPLDDNVIKHTEWRGLQKDSVLSRHTEDPQKLRVLVLVEGGGNRRQLVEQLRKQYTIVEPEDGALPLAGFDLAVVDGPGFRQWRFLLADSKSREQPVFLPVMLLLPRQDLRRRSGAYWDIIDDFIISPIDPNEFLERAAMLLRTRQLAREQQSELAYIVNHDRTTGLPNQTLFMDRLERAIHEATIIEQNVHVVVIHVPLTQVTKSLGREALEQTVQACTTRLRRIIGEGLSLARLTTEHWGLLCPTGFTVDEASDLCLRIGKFADEPVEVAGERIHISAYIGVGSFPEDMSTAIETVNAAFGALSRAQKPGKPYFYSRSVQDQALRYLRTESKLHEALEKRQFELWLQPQFRLKDRAIIGAEALIRWRLPNGEIVSPGNFIPVAESSGFITRIDRWVLETACADLAHWRFENELSLRIAVNITPGLIAESDFVPWLKHLFDKYEVPPPWLELELTETMFCQTDGGILDKLNELRDYGVTVAIDDFGTGYSSLSYLHQLPINVLKIDKSFTDRVPGDKTSEGITEAIIGLAQHFDLEIVAEGIETEQQLEYLKQLDVNTGQGFLIGRPVPQSQFLAAFTK